MNAPDAAGPDHEVQLLLKQLRDEGPDATPEALREAFLDFVREMERTGGPHADVERVYDTTFAGEAGPVPVRVYEPSGTSAATSDALVFLHGGGWVVGDLETGDLGARALSAGLGMRVVSVHYRLAPEAPFPAPLNDSLSVVRTVAASTSGAVFVAGESAGANLTAAVALVCRNTGDVRLAGQILINPAVDASASTRSHTELGEGYGLTTAAVRRFFGWYAGDHNVADPLISPINAENLVGVAPCLIVTAGFDPLLEDGVAYARRLIESGVPVTYLPMPTMMHGWWCLLSASPAARQELARLLRATSALVA